MAMPPNIGNYTVPGGVKLFFDDGTGERDLGNIVSLDITPGTDELEHYTNRSGKRAKDAVLTLEEKLSLKFKVDEPVMENWRYFFKGGAAENLGAGTANKTDQTLALTGTQFASVGAYYGLTAVSVRSFVDYCLLDDDSAGAFVDNSIEAKSLAGTPFEGIAQTADKLYFGKATKFKNLYLNLQTMGSYGARTWEYWNGSAWTTFVPTGTGEPMDADGNIALGTLAGWAKNTVNNKSAYWIRVSCATVTTPATIVAASLVATVNVDYSVDPGQAGADGRLPGRIARIAGGIFEDAEEVYVSFTYVTWTSSRFAISGTAFPLGSARLEVHPSTGRGLQFDIEIPKCQLKADGNISLDDKKWLEMGITLEVLDNSSLTPTYPYGRFVIYE